MTNFVPRLVLGSTSKIRAQVLKNAGLDFLTASPGVDENIVKRACKDRGATIGETALELAREKALGITGFEQDYILGADQILSFQDEPYDKPASFDEAFERLKKFQGKTHYLVSGTAIAKNGEIVWTHQDATRLKMREMSDEDINAYLEACDDDVLYSVGAYQLEKLGARLFDEIEGDYYTMLGLALLPILKFLRSEGLLVF